MEIDVLVSILTLQVYLDNVAMELDKILIYQLPSWHMILVRIYILTNYIAFYNQVISRLSIEALTTYNMYHIIIFITYADLEIKCVLSNNSNTPAATTDISSTVARVNTTTFMSGTGDGTTPKSTVSNSSDHVSFTNEYTTGQPTVATGKTIINV